MTSEGIDMAIRTGEPTSDQWLMRRLGQLNRRLYASPGYLEQHGTPDSVPAVKKHQLITHSVHSPLNRWTLNDGSCVRHLQATGPLMSDNFAALVSLALAGLGIARVPSVVGQPQVAQGRLHEFMPLWSAHPPRCDGSHWPASSRVPDAASVCRPPPLYVRSGEGVGLFRQPMLQSTQTSCVSILPSPPFHGWARSNRCRPWPGTACHSSCEPGAQTPPCWMPADHGTRPGCSLGSGRPGFLSSNW
jgi:hypothetical protein